MTYDYDEAETFLLVNNICTESELSLVTNICGRTKETLNEIIVKRTGYHDIEQLYACEPEFYNFYMIHLDEDD